LGQRQHAAELGHTSRRGCHHGVTAQEFGMLYVVYVWAFDPIRDLAVLAPPDFTNFFTQIGNYIIKIVTAGASVFLVIDMMGHVFRSPRDLKAAGFDLVVFIAMMVLFNKASTIVAWGISLVP